jgi:hypothetical protein
LPFQKVMVNILSFIHWIFLNNLFIDQRASRSCGSRICQTLTIRSSFNSSIFDHHWEKMDHIPSIVCTQSMS